MNIKAYIETIDELLQLERRNLDGGLSDVERDRWAELREELFGWRQSARMFLRTRISEGSVVCSLDEGGEYLVRSLGGGGMFLETTSPPAIGEEVKGHLAFRHAPEVKPTFVARVIWEQDEFEGNRGYTPGVGLQFLHLDRAARDPILRVLRDELYGQTQLSLKTYQMLFDNNPDIIFVLDRDLRVVEVNHPIHLRDTAGRSVQGLDFFSIFDTADQEVLRETLQRAAKSRTDQSTDAMMRLMDRPAPVEVRITWLGGDGPGPSAIVFCRDRTGQIHARQQMDHRLRLETTVARISSLLLYAHNREAGVTAALAQVCEMLQVHMASVFLLAEDRIALLCEWSAPTSPRREGGPLDQGVFNLWLPRLSTGQEVVIPDVLQIPGHRALERACLQARHVRSLIAVPMQLEGRLLGFIEFDDLRRPRIWADDDVRMLRLASETLMAFIQRKRIEVSLKESEEATRRILDNMDEIVLTYDLDQRCTFVSPSWEKHLGHEPDAVLGKRADAFVHSDDVQRFHSAMSAIVDTGSNRFLELRLCHRDGSYRTMEYNAVPLKDSEGMLIGTQAVCHDITYRRLLEDHVHQTQRLEAIGTLAGGLAHDFNNLLQVVSGLAEMVRGGMGDEGQDHRNMTEIINTCDKGQRLVRQLLTFARKQELQAEPLTINEVVQEVVPLLERTLPKEIVLEYHLEPTVPSINGDRLSLEQALLNICLNAHDAMGESGTLCLATYVTDLDEAYCSIRKDVQPGRYVVLEVSDTGTGMDEATRKRILEPFFTTKPKGKGSGMGLAMVFGTVKAHGGHIGVYSEPGRGTAVRLVLPVFEAKQEEKGDAKEEDVAERASGATILVVDDDMNYRVMTRRWLEGIGVKVLLAADGVEAVEIYEDMRAEIDLVLLDIVMPRMGGEATLRELRSINPDVRVVLTSGYSKYYYSDIVQKMEVEGFLAKPFSLGDVTKYLKSSEDLES